MSKVISLGEKDKQIAEHIVEELAKKNLEVIESYTPGGSVEDLLAVFRRLKENSKEIKKLS